jgi:hypothetical protein
MIAAMRRAIPLLLLLISRQALAQTPIELVGGYSLAHDPRDQLTLPAGWIAGAAISLTPAFSAVADISGQYKTIPLLSADARFTVHTVMGGVRGSARLGRMTEFGQIPAGAARTSARRRLDHHRTRSAQPGVGIIHLVTPRWAARAGGTPG